MANRLARSSSPYLQQHADNPVDWWEWGEEAFAEARRRDVPIFLSVGYAACHWCHVMAHESFENVDIAALLNEHFVSIKVDREERPDVDTIYMSATTALTGHGGWPMSVWLDHDGRPFYAGTYFPAVPRQGMPSFPQILTALAQAWRDRRDEVLASAKAISEGLADHRFQVGTAQLGMVGTGEDPLAALADAADVAVVGLAGSFDAQRGGFGGAPKFPPSMVLEFLLRHHAAAGGRGDAGALDMAVVTLEAMARGGMYDQLAGGFARYSVDADWVVPHFEKMLYDNALLLRVYAHWWRISGDVLAERVVRETAEFLLRDLRTEQGGFAAALDADAVPSAELAGALGHGEAASHGGEAPRAVEGASYVWTPQLLVDVLGSDDGTWAAQLLAVTDRGTFEHGTSTLQLRSDPDDPARWARVQAALLAVRDTRPQPARDDKVVAAWNGLAIAALAAAGAILGEEEWIAAAAEAAQLLVDVHMSGGELARVSRDGVVGTAGGVLADYADVAEGLLALYQASGDPVWFSHAERLLAAAVGRFYNEGAWVDHRTEGVLPAASDVADNAEPSGAAAVAHALLTLAALGGSVDDGGPIAARELSGELLAGQVAFMGRQPRFAGWWLAAAQAWLAGPREVAIVGPRIGAEELLATARRSASPGLVIAVGPGQGSAQSVGAGGKLVLQPPLLRDRPLIDGRATAYLCMLGACQRPTTDPAELAAQLRGPA